MSAHQTEDVAALRQRIAELERVTKVDAFTRDFHAITSDVSTPLDRKIVRLLERGCDFLEMETGIVSQIVDDDYEVLHASSRAGLVKSGAHFPLAETYCRKTLVADDPIGFVNAEAEGWAGHPAYVRHGAQSYLGVSVRLKGEPMGTLNFTSRRPRAREFTPGEKVQLKLMAQWLEHELTRAGVEAALRQREQELERLIHAAIRINAERTLEGVLQEIADSAREVIRCRYAALGILDPSGERLDEFVTSGMSPELIRRLGPNPTGKGVLGVVVSEPRPLRLRDLSEHPKAAGFPPHHPPMKSFLGVPVLGPEGPVGNLYFTDKEGGEFSEEDEAVAVMFAANAAVAVANANLDEEAARLLTELQALQQSRDRFYAMVNHELRNALTAVHGWAELFLRKEGPDPGRPVRETVEAAEYALELLNDLLDLNRLDASKIEASIADIDVVAVITDAAGAVEPIAAASGVRLDVVGTSAPVTARSDPTRLRQILINLLSNAIRHSPPGEVVTIDLTAAPETVQIAVIDRGEGIAATELAIIFDAYARAASNVGGGTGLGLTLSRRLAQLLGGDIDAQSELQQGARFTVTLRRFLDGDS